MNKNLMLLTTLVAIVGMTFTGIIVLDDREGSSSLGAVTHTFYWEDLGNNTSNSLGNTTLIYPEDTVRFTFRNSSSVIDFSFIDYPSWLVQSGSYTYSGSPPSAGTFPTGGFMIMHYETSTGGSFTTTITVKITQPASEYQYRVIYTGSTSFNQSTYSSQNSVTFILPPALYVGGSSQPSNGSGGAQIFDGWSTNQNATSGTYRDSSSNRITAYLYNRTITLYPIFVDNPSLHVYTLNFDLNGGTGTQPPTQTYSGTENNHVFMLDPNFCVGSPNAPKKTGFNFLGWHPNSNSTSALYGRSQTDLSVTINQSAPTMNLYAIYKSENPDPPIVVQPLPTYHYNVSYDSSLPNTGNLPANESLTSSSASIQYLIPPNIPSNGTDIFTQYMYKGVNNVRIDQGTSPYPGSPTKILWVSDTYNKLYLQFPQMSTGGVIYTNLNINQNDFVNLTIGKYNVGTSETNFTVFAIIDGTPKIGVDSSIINFNIETEVYYQGQTTTETYYYQIQLLDSMPGVTSINASPNQSVTLFMGQNYADSRVTYNSYLFTAMFSEDVQFQYTYNIEYDSSVSGTTNLPENEIITSDNYSYLYTIPNSVPVNEVNTFGYYKMLKKHSTVIIDDNYINPSTPTKILWLNNTYNMIILTIPMFGGINYTSIDFSEDTNLNPFDNGLEFTANDYTYYIFGSPVYRNNGNNVYNFSLINEVHDTGVGTTTHEYFYQIEFVDSMEDTTVKNVMNGEQVTLTTNYTELPDERIVYVTYVFVAYFGSGSGGTPDDELYLSIIGLRANSGTIGTIGNSFTSQNNISLWNLPLQYHNSGDITSQILIQLLDYVPDKMATITIGNECIISIERYGTTVDLYRFKIDFVNSNGNVDSFTSNEIIIREIQLLDGRFVMYVNDNIIAQTHNMLQFNGIWYVGVYSQSVSLNLINDYSWDFSVITSDDFIGDICSYAILLALAIGIGMSYKYRFESKRILYVWLVNGLFIGIMVIILFGF